MRWRDSVSWVSVSLSMAVYPVLDPSLGVHSISALCAVIQLRDGAIEGKISEEVRCLNTVVLIRLEEYAGRALSVTQKLAVR